jgi:hypothetical protein
MPVYKKILEVMKEVDYLVKDDTVSFSSTKYKGLREEVVTTKVRDAMVKHGLVVFPISQVHSREPIGEKGSVLSILDVTYRFVDTEDDTFFDAVSSGTGADTQDKGVGKAMTYAYKYLFLRTFAIPTGEDPDRIASAQLDDEDEKRKTPTVQRPVINGESADKAQSYRDAIKDLSADKRLTDQERLQIKAACANARNNLSALQGVLNNVQTAIDEKGKI